MISASRIELAMRCEGHLTIPHRDSPNSYSEAGNELHLTDEEAIASGDVPEVYAERWPGLTWSAEVSYVYDVSSDTARRLGVGLKRAYGDLGPFEIPGTIDVEGRGPGILVVVDRKSFEAVTPAAANPQVRFLALAAARVRSADRIEIAINHELSGLDVAEIDPAFDLDVIAHDTRQLLIRAAAIRGEARAGRPVAFNTGRWCRWCPAFDDCPRQKELRELTALDDDHPDLALTTFVDDESAADVYALWKRIGILHKRIGEQLYRHAATRPIPLGNGKMFGRHTTLGDREYDGPTVHAVVAAHPELGRDVADKVVEMVASQAQFKRVVGPLVKRGKFAATAKAVFGEVERLGKMKRAERTEISEFVPTLQLVAAPEPEEPAAPEVHDVPF